MAGLAAPFRCPSTASQTHFFSSYTLHATRLSLSANSTSTTLPQLPSRIGPISMSQPAADSSAVASSQDDAGKSDSSDVLVQYVVLRRDLIDTWPLGSVVTQGCHASVAAVWLNREDPHTVQYCSPENIDFMHKVTLEVKGEPQILNLSEKLKSGGIAHKLWVEQPEDIPTCLATKPYPKSIITSYLKKLKLCK